MINSSSLIRLAIVAFGFLSIIGCGSDSAPSAPSAYQAIGSFSANEMLAPVQKDNKWGFIDRFGNLRVQATYNAVRPFSEGYAGVEKDGNWGFIDDNGTEVIRPTYFHVGPFSEGLAPVETSSISGWGYMDTTGAFVIEPQFEKARPFSEGLAAVYKDGAWSYINSDGTTVLTTAYYTVFSFTKDGFAVVQETKNGNYEFIDKNGTQLPPIAVEKLDITGHHEGLAAVHNGQAWGYIDTQGNYIIQPTFGFATSFNEGMAAVRANGKFHFINTSGKELWSNAVNSFDYAMPFSGGLAVVGNGNQMWYIDKNGRNAGIATGSVLITPVLTGTECTQTPGLAIQNPYMGGLIQFQIQNHTMEQWTVNVETPSGAGPHSFLPGVPQLIDTPSNTMTQGLYKFFVKYTYGHSVPIFDLILSTTKDGNPVTVTLANSTQYTAPASGSPWWTFLKDAIKILIDLGKASMSGGTAWWPAVKAVATDADMIRGAIDDSANNNAVISTETNFYTALSGTLASAPFSPLGNEPCGGDQYIITDGLTYVMQLTAVRTSTAPPQVDLDIFYYANFFAIQAANALNTWRNYPNGQYLGPPWNGLYPAVFENYQDLTNDNLCYASTTQSYMQSASTFTVSPSIDQAMAWWNYSNSFATEAVENPSSTATWSENINCIETHMSLPEGTVYVPTAPNLGADCNISIPVYNPEGPVTFSGAFQPSSNNCTDRMSDCKMNFNIPITNSTTATVSDGTTSIGISIGCLSPAGQ